MRIVIAPDSFKECLSALEVSEALASGLRRALPDAELELVPMADGGEGTVDALVAATGGSTVPLTVTGPLGDPVDAVYGVLGDGTTAVIEMASASGLALVPKERRDPRIATTYGTGELLRAAMNGGATRIIIGIGGSATNDGGAGMAEALGYRFLDASGNPLPRGGAALADLARIDTSIRFPAIDHCTVQVACDVSNPLCGPNGASFVYGPQKGASPRDAEELDEALRHFAHVVRDQLGIEIAELPGAGAAGGLGAGLVAFARGSLRPGVDLVAAACRLAERLEGADFVVTGEGKLDGQSIHGKTPVGVATIAQKAGVRVIAVAGILGDGCEAVHSAGIEAVHSLTGEFVTPEYAIANAAALLAEAGERIGRTFRP
ncbi:MAG: glycerate kinase [Candidatus Hydrogenedentes bacterium]|nr:glycerate kinase [Candidatus Hydrogenedentota bacterium]